MKKGDVVTISVKGSAASKPRPAVLVQATEFIRPDRPVIVCPLTSVLANAPFFRIDIEPTAENGLRLPSQAMVDRTGPALASEIGEMVGHLSSSDLTRIELALTNILGLGTAAALMSGMGVGS